MNEEFERKPDGGLADWIDILEASENERPDTELLMLLIELRALRDKEKPHD